MPSRLLVIFVLGLTVCSVRPFFHHRRPRTWAPNLPFGHRTLVHEWVQLEYDWPSEAEKQRAIASGSYIPENSVINGIKLYKGRLFVTVPRWALGIPSTFNEVIVKNGRSVLRPFPSWEAQDVHNCSALQYVMSMEIDPNTGLMYLIDNGRVNTLAATPGTKALNLCPHQIHIYDLERNRFVKTHTFPDSVAHYNSSYLNDVMIDDQGYAFISDASGAGGLIVYDSRRDRSHRHEHPSMGADPDPAARTFNINTGYSNETYFFDGPINGIAMSPSFDYLYYCALTGFNLYQVPTSLVRDPNADIGNAVRNVGRKLSQSGGITHGENNLYYGIIPRNAVYYWPRKAEEHRQSNSERTVRLEIQLELAQDTETLQQADTFGWDDSGFLWLTTNRLFTYLDTEGGGLDFTGRRGANFRIFRVYVGEQSYLKRGAPLQEPTQYKCSLLVILKKAILACKSGNIFSKIRCFIRAKRDPAIVYSC
ncbi:protein yellow-like [Liolophura sinensis]|uniref:protein yellow-like n=1 Tax=Liolophura sinensis TaxID=3198878 RepID=UPI0031583E65